MRPAAGPIFTARHVTWRGRRTAFTVVPVARPAIKTED